MGVAGQIISPPGDWLAEARRQLGDVYAFLLSLKTIAGDEEIPKADPALAVIEAGSPEPHMEVMVYEMAKN